MRSPFFIRVVGRDHSLPAVARARRARFRALSLSFVILVATVFPASANPVIIGSKKFTESYVLGEIARRTLGDAGIKIEHRQGMGGTIILWQALQGGQIDAYPEYTGTIAQEILKTDRPMTVPEIANALAAFNIVMTEPLG